MLLSQVFMHVDLDRDGDECNKCINEIERDKFEKSLLTVFDEQIDVDLCQNDYIGICPSFHFQFGSKM